jgi:heat shock protein HtpX
MLDSRRRRRQKTRNVIQGLVLLGGLVALAAGVAWVLFGLGGVLWILGLGALIGALRPKVPTRVVLTMYGARSLAEEAAPGLYRIVRVLAQRAGLPAAPVLYYIPSSMTNAFAVGRGQDAALAITDGLLRRLTERQVVAVLAHEISHVRAGDPTVMNLSDTIGRLVHALSYLGIFSIFITLPLMSAEGDARPLLFSAVLVLLPTVVTLLQLALSRSREYDADLEGAALTGDPEGLAEALEALERSDGRVWERIMVPHRRVPDPLLLRTHPPTAERVRRLHALAPRDPSRHLPHPEPAEPLGYPRVLAPPRLRFPGIRW